MLSLPDQAWRLAKSTKHRRFLAKQKDQIYIACLKWEGGVHYRMKSKSIRAMTVRSLGVIVIQEVGTSSTPRGSQGKTQSGNESLCLLHLGHVKCQSSADTRCRGVMRFTFNTYSKRCGKKKKVPKNFQNIYFAFLLTIKSILINS